ncbi:phage major capsid protein [Methylophaga sp.]|uniref:phage major capsid protein n=1 Tax=Methylophaga sp. TaxID=2024840 RepID=UPI003A946F8A
MDAQLKAAIDDLGRGFEEFKSANDERLKQIEAKGTADPLLTEQVNKINSAVTDLQKAKDRIDDIEAKVNRGDFNGGGGQDVVDKAKAQHKAGFNNYFRKGHEAGLRDLEVQAMLTTQSDEDGGFTVHEEMDTEISRELEKVSAMRSIARVRQIGAADFKRWHNVGGASSGWVGEEEERTGNDDTPKLKELVFNAKELWAEPITTQSMLDDSSLNINQWLADEVGIAFAEQEGDKFITGNGVKQPRGLLNYTAKVNGTQAFGELGFIASGKNGGFADTNPGDRLISLQHALKAGYRGNARWLMNDLTLEEVRKFKDADGNYLWRAGLTEGAPDLLLGKQISYDDNMPDIAANSLSLAFGDFNRGYLIVDRMGVRVIRDGITRKGFVKFYTTKRVGGGLNDSNAIKVLKFTS